VGGYVAGLRADALAGARLGYDPADTNRLFLAALANLTRLGAVLVPMDTQAAKVNGNLGPEGLDATGATELALIPNEFKAGINAYLANEAGPGLPVSDLTGIIAYNQMHTDRVKYGQNLLIASDATPGVAALEGPAALPFITAQRANVDDDFATFRLDAIVGPGLSYYQGGAEAGYPTVMVPMGYTTSSGVATPHGLSFFGQAWTEAKLLGYAYAFEQGTHARRPPTELDPGLLKGVC
jgi:amidase